MHISAGTLMRAAGATALVAGAGAAAMHVLRDQRDTDPTAGFVRAEGNQLVVDDTVFRPFGFNHTFGDMLGTIEYTHDPTPEGLAKVRTEFENAKRMGANTLRVFFELHDFVERNEQTGKVTVREDRLDAYRNVLDEAERIGIKLDITGNVVWKPDSAPEWYDAMPHRERWQVQAEFWKAIARTGADSPAILCYELTSEPVASAKADAPWYGGNLGGYNFVQVMARGVEQAQLGEEMVQWTRTLRDAVKSEDPNHLVTVGMLPFYGGVVGAQNLADELDMLVLHDYPKSKDGDTSGIDKSITLAEQYASHGKPVMLGETFCLDAGKEGMTRYLRETEPHFAGTLSFYDGRHVDDVGNATFKEAFFGENLKLYLSLRDELMVGHGEPVDQQS